LLRAQPNTTHKRGTTPSVNFPQDGLVITDMRNESRLIATIFLFIRNRCGGEGPACLPCFFFPLFWA
jgi:hypothetical protein